MNKKPKTRRQFLDTTAKVTAALAGYSLISPLYVSASENKKTRVAIVGTGGRGTGMWGRSLLADQGDKVELVGLCDINPLRVKVAQEFIKTDAPTYTNFDQMVKETKPDKIIVTTVDATHHEYIIRGMQLGKDIITEKPMTTDEIKCKNILETEKQTGRKVIVTFNYRYSPHRQKMKEILMSAEIGEIVSVDFHWYLDIIHGADYFRRWHRLRERGGSLFVHKASHHFDLVNWWLEAKPVEVSAYGELRKYGKAGPYRHTTCRGCPYMNTCPFYWDILQDDSLKKLYVDCESADGYTRDGCVFRSDVNIWDTMTAQVKYDSGVHMSYSLNAFMPYEGYHIAFNGTKGRFEHRNFERQPWQVPDQDEIRLTKNFGATEIIIVKHGGGGHGGGDTRLRDMIFTPGTPDPYKQIAGSYAGAIAILPGIATRHSIDEKRTVPIAELIQI
jgi:predicted dehydrogenase